MLPDDRVLVVYVPQPRDFAILQQQGWYRVPQRHAPKGLYAEYFAFYFGRRFGVQKWGIHFYAERLGHELVQRVTLFPDEADHPRASDIYYKVQLGPLQPRDPPIISLRWRRLTFIHTTGDRFESAIEMNDLLLDGGDYVDRLFVALRERGIPVQRNYRVEEAGEVYHVPLAVLCANGRIDITQSQIPTTANGRAHFADLILHQIATKGGLDGASS